MARPQSQRHVLAGSTDTSEQRVSVACLAGPEGTVASHLTAAALLGPVDKPPAMPHVTVPRAASGRIDGAVVHRPRQSLRSWEVCSIGSLRCTTPARTLVDCAGLVGYEELCDMLDTALCRRMAQPSRVRKAADDAARGPGRKGIAQLYRALAVWEVGPRPGSPPEMRLFRRMLEWGLPMPQRQVKILDEDGRSVARVDIAVVERKVILAYDGNEYHGPRQSLADERRQDRVEGLGWTVVRITKYDLRRPATRLRRRLEELLLEPDQRLGGCA